MVRLRLASGALRALARPVRAGLERAFSDCAGAQAKALEDILAGSARTEYGRSLGLRPGMGQEEFRARAPAVDAAALSPWLERQRLEGGRVLAPEPVTSFSRVPRTAALERSFRRMSLAWAADLLRHAELRAGGVFLGASEAASASRFLEPFLIVPSRLRDLRSPDAAAAGSCLHLLARGEALEVLSMGDPAEFLALLDKIASDRAGMARAWSEGVFRAEGREFALEKADPRRLRLLEGGYPWSSLWPNLALISCRAEGASREGASRLRQMFPQAALQPKGLVCDEAPVSFPLVEAGGCLPMLTEVFLEFEEPGGRTRLASQAEPGGEYSVLVSQKGGLLRYRLAERVRVTGRHRQAPRLACA